MASKMGEYMQVLENFYAGGPFMWVILSMGVLTLAMIFERTRALYFDIKQPPKDFRDKILGFIRKRDFGGAEQWANSVSPQTSLTRIVATGCHLRANAAGEEELQARMDEKLSSEISAIDKRTGFLAMFGNVSTLLGLLGTISGMIIAFASVASANPADRAIMLSQGISEALNTTAFGLIVAIPALVAYAVFQNKTDRIVTEITEETSSIFHDLLFLSERIRPTESTKKHTLKKMSPQPAGA